MHNGQIYEITNEQSIVVREFKGQRVLPLKVIAAIHGKKEDSVKKTFLRNKSKFIQDLDYLSFEGSSGRQLLINNNYPKLEDIPSSNNFSFTLFTLTGYLLLVKSFNDNLSWAAYRRLINYYVYTKTNVENIYDTLRLMIDKLEENEIRINNMEINHIKQQEEVNNIKNKLETHITEGAITPTELAKRLNIYSLNDLPHAQVIEDICSVLKIKAKSRILRPEDKYTQFRMETKGNVQVIQCYLKEPAQKLIKEWWNINKDFYKQVEYYKRNTNEHLKGDPKPPYWLIWHTKRYIKFN